MIPIRRAALAWRDLASIDDYHRPRDPDAATDLGRSIIAAARIWRDFPLLAPLALDGNRRKWRVSNTPYSLFYRVQTDHVRILRVLHHAQDQARQ